MSSSLLITQDRLDYIVSKLELSQRKSEALASFLKEENLLAPGTKVTAYRKRQSVFQKFFTVNENKTFAYCHDIKKLMEKMEIEYKAEDWRLFIDSSSTSLKAVLLHKTNEKPSIPIAYCTDTKETYEKMDLIVKTVKYEEHGWRICCVLKVVAMLRGLQLGYTKFMCFLCNKGNQYQDHSWQPRDEPEPLQHNVMKAAIIKDMNKILMPYLHVKLGVVKSFIKTIVKTKGKKEQEQKHAKEVFDHLKDKFHISDAKIKEGL